MCCVGGPGARPFLPCMQVPGPAPAGRAGPVNSLPFLPTATVTPGTAKTNAREEVPGQLRPFRTTTPSGTLGGHAQPAPWASSAPSSEGLVPASGTFSVGAGRAWNLEGWAHSLLLQQSGFC